MEQLVLVDIKAGSEVITLHPQLLLPDGAKLNHEAPNTWRIKSKGEIYTLSY